MVVGPLAVGMLDKALVPEELNMPKTVTETDACGAHRNDEVRRENDAAVADPDMVLVEALADEACLAGRAANGQVIDAKELD